MGILSQSDSARYRSNYRLLGLIGQGQFGKVYCAAHRKSGKLVALKSLDRYRLSTQQFLRELRFLLSLRHRHIVACQALEHTRRGRYLVMEYCPGGTLRELLEDEQCRVNRGQGLKLINDVLQGLAHAHSHRILHCDIKPENILLDPTPNGWNGRITDFGIAQVIQDLKTTGSGTSGSPAYMAPERFYGQYHLSADLYAVGIILFELLVGERPFTGTPLELMCAHLNQIPTIPDSVPPPLEKILVKSLKKLPGQRFQSAEDMRLALSAAIDQLDLRSSGPSPYFEIVPSPAPHSGKLTSLAAWSTAGAEYPLSLTVLGNLKSGAVTDRRGLCWAMGDRVCYKPFPDAFSSDPKDFSILSSAGLAVSLPASITDLHPVRNGCLIVTTQGLWFWNLADPTKLNLLYAWKGLRTVQVDPEQRWFTATSLDTEPQILMGSLRNLVNRSPEASPLRPLDPFLSSRYSGSLAVYAVDAGHGVILSDRHGESWIEGFNRRGKTLGELSLHLQVSHGIVTQKPYRLVGLEPNQPHLIFIDLKPFRVRRISLPSIPQRITCFSWGYSILAGVRQTQLLFVDLDGRMLGQVIDEVSTRNNDRWEHYLYTMQDWGLFILRQNDRQAILQLLDLQTIDLDLIF